MLIVGCQSCGEAKILAGTPDIDGVARIDWSCPHCGAGQVLQLDVAGGARVSDLHSILGGMPLGGPVFEDVESVLRGVRVGAIGEM
jgi:ribosomal protein S27AE